MCPRHFKAGKRNEWTYSIGGTKMPLSSFPPFYSTTICIIEYVNNVNVRVARSCPLLYAVMSKQELLLYTQKCCLHVCENGLKT